MGLLDDAIKEHLELKRKHGAAEEDLRRQETEALGPARRDFSGDAARVEEPAAAEPTDPGTVAPEPVAEPAGWLDEDEGPFEPAAAPPPPEPVEAVEPPEPVAETPEPVAEAPARVAEPEPEPPAPRRESDTPTQGFDALSADDEPPAEGEDDVLEETPDFLQDTPEHDRLWFEQKPPRDFDFDD
jgi:outer membrane biosynthesis protein TonB